MEACGIQRRKRTVPAITRRQGGKSNTLSRRAPCGAEPDAGRGVAEKIYERHLFFTKQLVAVGVDQETAERDACRIEHAISEEAFQKLKASVEKQSNDTA